MSFTNEYVMGLYSKCRPNTDKSDLSILYNNDSHMYIYVHFYGYINIDVCTTHIYMYHQQSNILILPPPPTAPQCQSHEQIWGGGGVRRCKGLENWPQQDFILFKPSVLAGATPSVTYHLFICTPVALTFTKFSKFHMCQFSDLYTLWEIGWMEEGVRDAWV
jgi:hypothetical protein